MLKKLILAFFLLSLILLFLNPANDDLTLNIKNNDLSYDGEIYFYKESDGSIIKNLILEFILKTDQDFGNLDEKITIIIDKNKYDLNLSGITAENKTSSHPVMGSKGAVIGMATTKWKEFNIKIKLTSELNQNIINNLTDFKEIIFQFYSEEKPLLFRISKKFKIKKLNKFFRLLK